MKDITKRKDINHETQASEPRHAPHGRFPALAMSGRDPGGDDPFFQQLLRCVSTQRGLRLTFRSGGTDKTIGLSWEATSRILRALEAPTKNGIPAERLTLTVLGHQVVRAHEAKGLLLHTMEWGIVVFALPQEILPKLITDLAYLASSPRNSNASKPNEQKPRRRKTTCHA